MIRCSGSGHQKPARDRLQGATRCGGREMVRHPAADLAVVGQRQVSLGDPFGTDKSRRRMGGNNRNERTVAGAPTLPRNARHRSGGVERTSSGPRAALNERDRNDHIRDESARKRFERSGTTSTRASFSAAFESIISFAGNGCVRLRRLLTLLDEGELDDDVRWRSPAAA
jgi:hypothetical protein